ncbi:MAG: hypothetical protein M3151_09110 [Actinomycetota bacterium]|nr:hypothetical protein [Actinomycetota bacterium]
MLPDTTTEKRERRRRSAPLLTAACSSVLLLAAVMLVWGQRDFSPGEELVAPGVEDVAVSPEATTSYPQSDVLRLEEGHKVVYVYLRVQDLATDGELGARVERSSRTPALARLFGGRGIRVLDEEEDRLGASDGRVSGVVRFAVRAGSGGTLPAGDYTVEVSAKDGDSRRPVARKYFVVGD